MIVTGHKERRPASWAAGTPHVEFPMALSSSSVSVDEPAPGQGHPEAAQPASAILVGHGGPLVVPREDLAIDLDDGLDLDLGALQAKKVRRPGRREWFALDPARALPTRLLIRNAGPNGLELEHYYVSPEIRGPIREELRDVQVYPFWSYAAQSLALWVVSVTPDNSWYESILPLFQRPVSFYDKPRSA